MIHPPAPFDWGAPRPSPVRTCECRLCAPPCPRPAPSGYKWCALCYDGFHLWAEAPCGDPFHGEACECVDETIDTPYHVRRARARERWPEENGPQ